MTHSHQTHNLIAGFVKTHLHHVLANLQITTAVNHLHTHAKTNRALFYLPQTKTPCHCITNVIITTFIRRSCCLMWRKSMLQICHEKNFIVKKNVPITGIPCVTHLDYIYKLAWRLNINDTLGTGKVFFMTSTCMLHMNITELIKYL